MIRPPTHVNLSRCNERDKCLRWYLVGIAVKPSPGCRGQLPGGCRQAEGNSKQSSRLVKAYVKENTLKWKNPYDNYSIVQSSRHE